MFELKITNLREALLWSQHWATHIISVLDPDYPLEVPKPNPNSLLRRYFFHDISTCFFMADEMANFKLATCEQIQDILEFTAALQEHDKLLIHCHAGISRSTAVACGVLCQHGISPALAVKLVTRIRPQAFPNAYVIALFDEKLGLAGQLKQAVAEKFGAFYVD